MVKVNQQPWFDRGLFSLSYIPFHLSVILFELPGVISEPPYIVPSLSGMSIFLTTPAFIYAFLPELEIS
jgi:uncharacterized membrane protein